MASYKIYSNHNGNVRQSEGNLDDISLDRVLDEFFAEPITPSPLVQLFANKTPVRTKKSSVSSNYPPSESYFNKSKEKVWNVALTGLSDRDISVDCDDGVIVIEVLKDAESFLPTDVIYDYKNLKLPKKGDVIRLSFDADMYDPNSFNVAMNNGLLKIIIQLREERKPVSKHLFGSVKTVEPEPEDEEKAEDNAETSD